MVVSVPEKTLEHWASIYLTYRYRSHAALWWPTSGEDIHVGYLSPYAGKAVQLELKTTTLSSSGDVHGVQIDLWQLDNYLARPHHRRPFYVFRSRTGRARWRRPQPLLDCQSPSSASVARTATPPNGGGLRHGRSP